MSAWVAGVDEAGRGPLAGPVVAAAVILDPQRPIVGLADSKALSPAMRAELVVQIRQHALCFGIGQADHREIDQLNILQATLLAMRRALQQLAIRPAHIQVDGNRLPRTDDLGFEHSIEAIVKGDVTHPCISAASILAKTTRDALMEQMDARYPGFGFAVHKGYPTPAHLAALHRLGPSPLHRLSFGPVRSLLPNEDRSKRR